MSNIIWFYWDGLISPSRLKILKDSVYSTRVWNPERPIILVSNTLTQSEFDDRYEILVSKWSDNFFSGLPISEEKLERYKKANPRDFSDLFRLILLYQNGGTYVDTDDLCINRISETPNIVCRSYDPHTSFYNKIEGDGCVPGFVREIKGYEHIPMFPRNDCWQNWKPKSPFIFDMLNNPKFQGYGDVVWIGGDWSWQSIANETCIKWLPTHGTDWNFRLTLLYLFEDFVSASSFWDRCHHGGEMCDIWKGLPNVNDYEWGFYKCEESVARVFYEQIIQQYPNLSHLWLHSKDMKEEWFIDLEKDGKYSISTWIYKWMKDMINEYK